MAELVILDTVRGAARAKDLIDSMMKGLKKIVELENVLMEEV